MATTPRWKTAHEAVSNNDLAAVKYFIETQKFPLTITDDKEKTIALIAAENANLPILKYILQKDDSVLQYGDYSGNNIMQRAIEKGTLEMVKYLVEQHNWPISMGNSRYSGNTALHHAAKEGRLEILKYFVEQKHANVDLRNDDGVPPLFMAAEKPYMDIIKYLVEECKANVTILNNHYDNILYESAKRGDLKVPKYLLDERMIYFDVNWRDKFNCTVVYVACRYGSLELVDYLVNEKHADLNIPDAYGRSPLHVAAFRNNYPMCDFLIERGANLTAEDKTGKSPTQLATNTNLMKYLEEMVPKRERRSVYEVPNSYLEARWLPVPHGDSLIISSGSWSENPLGVIEEISEVHDGQVDTSSLLVIANMVIRYIKGKGYQWPRKKVLYSTQEFIHRRVDSISIDVDNSLHAFGKP